MTTPRPSAAQLRLLRLLAEGPRFAVPQGVLIATARVCLRNGWVAHFRAPLMRAEAFHLTDTGRAAIAAAEGAGT